MGLIDGIMGHASEADAEALQDEFAELLVDGERVERGYRVVRDVYLFTDRRLVLIDKQGMTGKKQQYHSLPYGKIQHFSIETAGAFDRDAELKIWLSGSTLIQRTFNKKLDVFALQRVLASYVLR